MCSQKTYTTSYGHATVNSPPYVRINNGIPNQEEIQVPKTCCSNATIVVNAILMIGGVGLFVLGSIIILSKNTPGFIKDFDLLPLDLLCGANFGQIGVVCTVFGLYYVIIGILGIAAIIKKRQRLLFLHNIFIILGILAAIVIFIPNYFNVNDNDENQWKSSFYKDFDNMFDQCSIHSPQSCCCTNQQSKKLVCWNNNFTGKDCKDEEKELLFKILQTLTLLAVTISMLFIWIQKMALVFGLVVRRHRKRYAKY